MSDSEGGNINLNSGDIESSSDSSLSSISQSQKKTNGYS